MPPADFPGGPRISLKDAHDHALARLRNLLKKDKIEDELVATFAHRDIDVPGWYRIEDGETVFGTELQVTFWSGIRRGDNVDWQSNECRYTVVYDKIDVVTESVAYELQVRRDQLETWITSQERDALGGEAPRRRAQAAKHRNTKIEYDAKLRNRIQGVIAAARALNKLKDRAIANKLIDAGKHQGFSFETLRKIIGGTYLPQIRLGMIPGLREIS